jgi:PAS domain S-box-containing protein
MALLTAVGAAPLTTNQYLDASLLAEVINSAPTPLWVMEPTGTVMIANRAAVTFLGYRRASDILGGVSHDLLHRSKLDGSDYSPDECPIVRSKGSGSASIEWFLTRDGDARPVSWSTRAIGRGELTLLSFTATDADTARSTAERHLHHNVHPPAPSPSREAVRMRLWAIMRDRFADPAFSPSELAAAAHLSTRSVQALFQEIGRSPASEIRRIRLEHARTILERGHSVQSACINSGYSDPNSFARAFRQRYGHTPSQTNREQPITRHET